MTTLKPFTPVTRAAAIAGFAGTPVEYCDGQVVIVGSAILLFATVGTSPEQTRLVAPDRLEWRPARNDYHPDEKIPWLPAVAIPRVDHDRAEWLSYTHVLVQPAGTGDEWLYCGPAHLGSYSYAEESTPPGPGGPALYSFDAGRLPAHHWPALRGWRGWEVAVEGTVHYLTASDRAAFSTLLESLQEEEMTDVEIARWEGDAFQVHLNRERGCPVYLPERYASSGLYVVWDAREPWARQTFCVRVHRTVGVPTARNPAARGRAVIADGLLRTRCAAQARRRGACRVERANALCSECHTPAEPSALER